MHESPKEKVKQEFLRDYRSVFHLPSFCFSIHVAIVHIIAAINRYYLTDKVVIEQIVQELSEYRSLPEIGQEVGPHSRDFLNFLTADVIPADVAPADAPTTQPEPAESASADTPKGLHRVDNFENLCPLDDASYNNSVLLPRCLEESIQPRPSVRSDGGDSTFEEEQEWKP